MSFWCLQISKKKTNEIFARVCALASKKRSNQTSSVRYVVKINRRISGIKCPYFFDLTPFKRLGQKSLKKFRSFLGDLKTPKGHFEIN